MAAVAEGSAAVPRQQFIPGESTCGIRDTETCVLGSSKMRTRNFSCQATVPRDSGGEAGGVRRLPLQRPGRVVRLHAQCVTAVRIPSWPRRRPSTTRFSRRDVVVRSDVAARVRFSRSRSWMLVAGSRLRGSDGGGEVCAGAFGQIKVVIPAGEIARAQFWRAGTHGA